MRWFRQNSTKSIAIIIAEDEDLLMKLTEIGIPKELLRVDQAEFQQQAMDILVLLLGKGLYESQQDKTFHGL